MKPGPFRYRRAASVEEAVAMLAEDSDAWPLSGGQSLVPMMNMRIARPSVLVDLNGIAGLDAIDLRGGCLRIGALVRHAGVAASRLVRDWLPLLAHMAETIGYYPIRQRGTHGGSLAHADPGAQFVLAAILLNPEIVTVSSEGERRIAGRGFFLAPYETVLRRGEIVAEVLWPTQMIGEGWGFHAVRKRAGDFAIVACAVHLALNERERPVGIELAFSGLGPLPVRVEAKVPTDVTIPAGGKWLRDIIGDILQRLDKPSDEYRAHLAHVLAQRAIGDAVAVAQGTLQ